MAASLAASAIAPALRHLRRRVLGALAFADLATALDSMRVYSHQQGMDSVVQLYPLLDTLLQPERDTALLTEADARLQKAAQTGRLPQEAVTLITERLRCENRRPVHDR